MTTSSKKQKIILKKIKPSGIIWHPDSTLVFKSATDKVVIGRMQNEVFIEMDEKTLDLCNEYNFIPDDSLLESDHDDKENCDDEVDAHDDVPPDEVDEQDDVPPDDEVENITSKSKIHLDGIMEYVSKLSVNNEILLANSRSRNKEIQELKNTIDNLKLQVENNNTRLTQLKNLLI